MAIKLPNKEKIIDLKKRIEIEAKTIRIPNGLDTVLGNAYQLATAIDKYLLEEYFPVQKEKSVISRKRALKKILEEFEEEVVLKLENQEQNFEKLRSSKREKNRNIFIVAGAKKLYVANKYTRVISESLGHKLEKIVGIDTSKSFDSEDIGIKIKGVDKFILNADNGICHTQIKTKKDTLTGSQVQRSIIELKHFPNPLFAAALELGGGWNFPNHPKIKRITGNEFWNLVGFEYEYVLKTLSKTILNIEQRLF